MHWSPLAFCIAVAPLISQWCYSSIDISMLDTNNAAAHCSVHFGRLLRRGMVYSRYIKTPTRRGRVKLRAHFEAIKAYETYTGTTHGRSKIIVCPKKFFVPPTLRGKTNEYGYVKVDFVGTSQIRMVMKFHC